MRIQVQQNFLFSCDSPYWAELNLLLQPATPESLCLISHSLSPRSLRLEPALTALIYYSPKRAHNLNLLQIHPRRHSHSHRFIPPLSAQCTHAYTHRSKQNTTPLFTKPLHLPFTSFFVLHEQHVLFFLLFWLAASLTLLFRGWVVCKNRPQGKDTLYD